MFMRETEFPAKIDQMIFIYNALNDGWTVKKVEENNFEFVKKKNKREIDLEKETLSQFIMKNL